MTFIVAEAGVNHNGNWTKALDLIDAAHKAGADAVKFQMFNSQNLWGDDRIKHLELKPDAYEALKAHCDEAGIEFMCTPFDVASCNYLASLLKRIKIASGCIRRSVLLMAARDTKLPVILSTGMSTYTEIREALFFLNRDTTTLLHCTSAYPCPLEDVNLKAMSSMRMLGCDVGYSDHTEGILASICAVAKGAKVIEKHLTLDRSAGGPDQKASIEPYDFSLMVREIRSVEKMLGSMEKCVRPCEAELHKEWRAHD